MKKYLGMALFLLVFVTPAFAQGAGVECNPCTATWSAGTGTVSGYRLYLYTSPTGTPIVKDIGKPSTLSAILSTQFTLTGDTQYYLAMSAYNAAGESAKSSQVPFMFVAAPPGIPGNVTVTK